MPIRTNPPKQVGALVLSLCQIIAHCVDAIERAAINIPPFQRVIRIASPLLKRAGRALNNGGRLLRCQIRAAQQRIDVELRWRRNAAILGGAASRRVAFRT